MRMLLLTALLTCTFAHAPAYAQTLQNATLWYAAELRDRFPGGIPVHGYTHALDEVGVSPVDITHFDVNAQVVQGGTASFLRVSGTFRLDPLPDPVRTLGSPRYMIKLQGYVFSPDGRLVWTQQAFPQGDAWIGRDGGTRRLQFANSIRRSLAGGTLIILALGDPLLMDGAPDAYVILGIKKLAI